MDLDFVRIGSMRGTRMRAAFDYPAFVAGLTAAQALSATARADMARTAAPPATPCPALALATVFEARAGWARSAAALGGSFHPAVAGLLSENKPLKEMTGVFTFVG